MDRAKFARAAEIFADASSLDSAARRAFIDDQCAGDAELQAEVHRLFERTTGADEYFEDLSQRLGVAAASGHPHDERGRRIVGHAGLRIGPYALTEPVGSGGTGTVWRAQRTDGQFEGDVAIKLVQPTAKTAAALGRAAVEAQHLATLSHPNIARLLDAGIDDETHPYLVLEFIDGTPIDVYCNAHRLDIRARIRQFIHVLRAVAHAHSHLIVHRDIKPGNVLVDREGHVKLLDFGIAKLLNTEIGSRTGETMEIGAALTPEYAAPEQLNGKPVTTATDVYALGMVLYELLAGSSPRDTMSVDSFAALVDVATQDPPKASASVASARHCGTSNDSLRRTLRGDLDNILQKAMAPEPADRYATAAEFATDLERYLDGETVSAMPPTLSYRTRKFVGRHRGSVATTLLTGVALLVSLGLATLQMFEAKKQRDAALYQQQRTMASNEFLRLLLAEVGPGGKALTLDELLDSGIEMLDRSFDQDYPFLGRMYYDLAISYFTLSETAKMLELFERGEERARAQDDSDLVAAILCSRARIQLNVEPERSIADVAEARALLEALDAPTMDTVMTCARASAAATEAEGDREAAMQQLRDALDAIGDSQLPSVQNRIFTMAQLANMAHKNDDRAEGLVLAEQMAELMQQTGRGNTVNYLFNELNRSVYLHSMGEILTAFEIREDLLERVRGMREADQTPIAFLSFYAVSLSRLGRYEEALRFAYEALTLTERAGNENRSAQNVAMIGRILTKLKRFEEAEEHLASAESVFLKSPTANDRVLQTLKLSRARLSFDRGDVAVASDFMSKELKRLDYPNSTDAPGLDGTLKFAARIALQTGDVTAAEQYADDCYELAVKAARSPKASANVGYALLLRAKARLALERHAAASDDLALAHEALTNSLGSDHPETVEARELLQDIQRTTS